MSTEAQSTVRPDVHARWRERSAPFTAEVEAVTDWDAASPCEDWTTRDVLAHVIDTETEFLVGVGLVSARQGPGTPADRTAAQSTPADGATADGAAADDDPALRWRTHLAGVAALLSDPAIAARPHDGAFGPTTVGTVMIEFYGFDLIVHRWDLARSQGRDARLDEQELALIDAAVDGWGEHAYAPGIFAPPVPVPTGADEQTRVLARTGRRG